MATQVAPTGPIAHAWLLVAQSVFVVYARQPSACTVQVSATAPVQWPKPSAGQRSTHLQIAVGPLSSYTSSSVAQFVMSRPRQPFACIVQVWPVSPTHELVFAASQKLLQHAATSSRQFDLH